MQPTSDHDQSYRGNGRLERKVALVTGGDFAIGPRHRSLLVVSPANRPYAIRNSSLGPAEENSSRKPTNPMTPEEKAGLSTRFAQRVPSLDEAADVFLEAESFRMFAPLDGGNLLTRLVLTSDETFDLAINPVCAVRLAATILDQLSKSGDYVIDLSIFEAKSGEQTARVRPSASTSVLQAN
jgi:hypothetical protein